MDEMYDEAGKLPSLSMRLAVPGRQHRPAIQWVSQSARVSIVGGWPLARASLRHNTTGHQQGQPETVIVGRAISKGSPQLIMSNSPTKAIGFPSSPSCLLEVQ